MKTNYLTTFQKQSLFSLRSRSYNLKSNYKSLHEEDMKCRICEGEGSYEDEVHTFEKCSAILPIEERNGEIKFEHIFGNLDDQIQSIKYFARIIKKRHLLLEIK